MWNYFYFLSTCPKLMVYHTLNEVISFQQIKIFLLILSTVLWSSFWGMEGLPTVTMQHPRTEAHVVFLKTIECVIDPFYTLATCTDSTLIKNKGLQLKQYRVGQKYVDSCLHGNDTIINKNKNKLFCFISLLLPHPVFLEVLGNPSSIIKFR